MSKKLSAIEDFLAYSRKLETVDLPRMRKLLVKLYSSRSLTPSEVQSTRAQLNDFCLWVKGVLSSYLSSIIGEYPGFPNRLIETFEIEIMYWEMIRKEVRKLDLARPAAQKYRLAYIQAVCAQIDKLFNKDVDELHSLVEIIQDWARERRSA